MKSVASRENPNQHLSLDVMTGLGERICLDLWTGQAQKFIARGIVRARNIESGLVIS